MTARTRNLVRARCVQRQAWWLSMQVAADGWTVDCELALDGLVYAWHDCERVMGVE